MEVGMFIKTSYEKDAFDISANEWKRTGSSQQKLIKQQVKKKKHSIKCVHFMWYYEENYGIKKRFCFFR